MLRVDSMVEVVVDLQLSRGKYLQLYKTYARSVQTIDREGRSVRFPASILQPFVNHEGVRGTFLIRFDNNKKFQQIERLT